MSNEPGLDALLARAVRELFAANPVLARSAGAHEHDAVLPPVGEDAARARLAELSALEADLAGVDPAGLDADARADLGTARAMAAEERFELERRRAPWADPRWAVQAGGDVWSYVARAYAPAPQRAEALCRHLEQLPAWLDEAGALLDEELAAGPRQVAVDEVRGLATFYRGDVATALGPLGDPGLSARLDRAIAVAAEACERHAALIQGRGVLADGALGAAMFTAMLEAQEGVVETVVSLRARAAAELERLEARAGELAARAGATSVAAAFTAMEAVHPTADRLVSTATEMLDRLQDFWRQRDVITLPTGVGCSVIPSPAFMSWVTAAYENPGALDPPGLAHYYFVTPVDPSWDARRQEEWLSHLNMSSLENISVHEVFPGHFVHCAATLAQPSLTRKVSFFSGPGEGWAHYTELLAIEQGLAEGRPLLELAMVQDALLRVCRFQATLLLHTGGGTVEEATRIFEEHAHIPRLAAEREALRGTYDPMYLVYTYGKLEILRWREELAQRPGFRLKDFHDRLVGCGFAPLSVVRDHVVGDA